jgi:hypothetical protein
MNYSPDIKSGSFISGHAQNKLLRLGSLKPELMKLYGRQEGIS